MGGCRPGTEGQRGSQRGCTCRAQGGTHVGLAQRGRGGVKADRGDGSPDEMSRMGYQGNSTEQLITMLQAGRAHGGSPLGPPPPWVTLHLRQHLCPMHPQGPSAGPPEHTGA